MQKQITLDATDEQIKHLSKLQGAEIFEYLSSEFNRPQCSADLDECNRINLQAGTTVHASDTGTLIVGSLLDGLRAL
jgi:hypothetical protein